MRAAFVPRYGPPEVVEIRELPTPEPGKGEVRIRVIATAVTAGDWRVRSGRLPGGFGLLRGLALGFGGPRKGVLGTDAAGVVDALGAGVTRFKLGDAVLAFPGITMGAHAEYLIMPETGKVVPKPANLDFEEAAALPFGGMTALDFLRRGAVKTGERVLVNGASGNVGSALVQLAHHLGAHVTAVCSAANAELVRSLGADEVIDYRRTDFAGAGVGGTGDGGRGDAGRGDVGMGDGGRGDAGRGNTGRGAAGAPYDVIADTVGNAPYARVKNVLAPGGRLLAVLADLPATLTAPFAGRRHHHRVVAGPAAERVEDLVTLAALAEQGVFRPVIDRRFGFAEMVEAYRVVDGGRKRGSVVVRVG